MRTLESSLELAQRLMRQSLQLDESSRLRKPWRKIRYALKTGVKPAAPKGGRKRSKRAGFLAIDDLEALWAYQLVASGTFSYRSAYYLIKCGLIVRPKGGALAKKVWEEELYSIRLQAKVAECGVEYLDENEIKVSTEVLQLADKSQRPRSSILPKYASTGEELLAAKKEAARANAAGKSLVDRAIREFRLAQIPRKRSARLPAINIEQAHLGNLSIERGAGSNSVLSALSLQSHSKRKKDFPRIESLEAEDLDKLIKFVMKRIEDQKRLLEPPEKSLDAGQHPSHESARRKLAIYEAQLCRLTLEKSRRLS